ncbi:MAG: hypothetical protein ACKOTB_17525 [Planctomycetia bacterium]
MPSDPGAGPARAGSGRWDADTFTPENVLKCLLHETQLGNMTACSSLGWIAKRLNGGDMKRPATASRQHRRPPLSGRATTKADVVAWIAAVLRQMDHAADLVIAFFRSIGMMGDDERTVPPLPPEFLLELASLLQLREWQNAGVIEWNDPDGLSIDKLVTHAINRLQSDPQAAADERRGTEAMIALLRTWHETCAPTAREHLDADIAVRWDNAMNMDDVVDALATFLCRHRDAGLSTEAE